LRGARILSGLIALILLGAALARAQAGATVEAQAVIHHVDQRDRSGNEDVVVWLVPLNGSIPHDPGDHHYRMQQKNKEFHPHVLAVPLGAAVEFPNLDPWFHNVFSLYKGERFDLGLYEAGSSRTVRFDRPGVSFIFCNIHPQMIGYVLALETPYFSVSDRRGLVRISDVPPGRYRLEAWFERAESPELAKLSREVNVTGPTTSLGTIQIRESALTIPPHKDKHGDTYQTDRVPY
jgi:plastocyanin